MLLPELWEIILKLLDHETLIQMPYVCQMFTNQMVSIILKERQSFYPRFTGQAKIHKVPFTNYCDKILNYLITTKVDLVKGDIVVSDKYVNTSYKAIYDGHQLIQFWTKHIEYVVLPKIFDFIRDNVPITYWHCFDACFINHINDRQELLDNIKHNQDNMLTTTITKNNLTHRFLHDNELNDLNHAILSNDPLYCFIENDFYIY